MKIVPGTSGGILNYRLLFFFKHEKHTFDREKAIKITGEFFF
jgi:hypothetical protein